MKLLILLFFIGAFAFAQSNPLEYTKWRLVEIRNSELKLPARGQITITFEQGRALLRACNNTSGAYTLDGSKLTISPGPSTRRACPPDIMAFDDAFSKLAASSPAFSLDATALTLTGSAGDQWIFRKLPHPSANAVTKFVYVSSETMPCTANPEKRCLRIRDEPTQEWREYTGRIYNFRPQPGIDYRLRIKEDAGKWFLDLIVEQAVVKK
jgi:heat shock protein HslJ